MKKLVAALLFSLASAACADMMVLQNQGGGFIALSKDACPLETEFEKPLFTALTTTETYTVPGCWYFEDMEVYVFWFPKDQDVVQAKYSATDFEFVPSE